MSRRHLGRAPIDWDSVIPLLGTMSDNDLARKLGYSHTVISRMRGKLKIPPHGLTPALLEDLGKDTDMEIARRHGVHRAFVGRLRRERDIPKFVAPHGTDGRYRAGCRCKTCLAAKAERAREYRRRNPEIVRAIDKRRRRRRSRPRDANSWMWSA